MSILQPATTPRLHCSQIRGFSILCAHNIFMPLWDIGSQSTLVMLSCLFLSLAVPPTIINLSINLVPVCVSSPCFFCPYSSCKNNLPGMLLVNLYQCMAYTAPASYSNLLIHWYLFPTIYSLLKKICTATSFLGPFGTVLRTSVTSCLAAACLALCLPIFRIIFLGFNHVTYES